MAEGWKDRFHEAWAQMLHEVYQVDAVQVVGFEDYTYYDGYCETCYYQETRCKISYIDVNGDTMVYDCMESFSDLMEMLL